MNTNNIKLINLHIIHRIDKTNTGDMVSNCSEYYSFEDYHIIKHDIYSPNFEKIKENDPIILSGGGLLNCLEIWNKNINKLLELSTNVFGWGIGFNKHHNTNINTKINLYKFKLLGIRDYLYKYESNMMYVPCSSCNLPQFKKSYKIKRNIGICEHKDFKINLPYEKINNRTNIDIFISFIGESEVIITNTYHCLYFCILMNKHVILYDIFSEKFNNIKYNFIKYSGDINKDISTKITNSNILNEIININNDFYDKVRNNLINI